jgi:hypothetical protein
MKKKLLHFTNHLGKPAAVRAEDVLYIQTDRQIPEHAIKFEYFTEICTYNSTKLIAQESAEELIKALSEIIEQ